MGPPPRSAGRPKGAADREKVARARGALILGRRSKGESLESIGKSYGIEAASVGRIVAEELQRRALVSEPEARHLRQLELDRVDRWTRTQEKRHAANGDPKAAEMLLRLQARRLALSGVRIDLSEPETGSRGRHIVDTGRDAAGSLPPFLQATLARAAALGGALGYAAGLAQGSAPIALGDGEQSPARALPEPEALDLEAIALPEPEPIPAPEQSPAPAESQEPASPTASTTMQGAQPAESSEG